MSITATEPESGAEDAAAAAQPSAEPAGKDAEPMIEIAGVVDWHRPGGMACGAATSLYERHPVTGETAGNPMADVRSVPFSVVFARLTAIFLAR